MVDVMTVRELIEKLEVYANQYGDDIPVRTFDLDRDVCDISEVEVWDYFGKAHYIYIGS